MLKTQLKFIVTIVLVLGLSISLQSLLASWQAPTATPPSQPNIFKPINTGPITQPKQGGLNLGGNLGVGLNLNVLGQITGGFGAVTSGGSSQDWNDPANTRPGSGYTLLTGNDPHGPGGVNYFHTLNFEYSSKDGSGNITQLAIPYANSASQAEGIKMRGRYGGSWTSWNVVGGITDFVFAEGNFSFEGGPTSVPCPYGYIELAQFKDRAGDYGMDVRYIKLCGK